MEWWEDAIDKLDYLKDKGFRFYFPVVYKAFTSPENQQNQIIMSSFFDDEDQEKADSQLENLKETIQDLKDEKIIATESDLLKIWN